MLFQAPFFYYAFDCVERKNKKMIVRSKITNELYDKNDCVFFKNPVQSAFYFENGVMPVDIFPEENGKWVWVFWKKDHKKMIEIWDNRRENYE